MERCQHALDNASLMYRFAMAIALAVLLTGLFARSVEEPYPGRYCRCQRIS